jgi:hypothetical protein
VICGQVADGSLTYWSLQTVNVGRWKGSFLDRINGINRIAKGRFSCVFLSVEANRIGGNDPCGRLPGISQKETKEAKG